MNLQKSKFVTPTLSLIDGKHITDCGCDFRSKLHALGGAAATAQCPHERILSVLVGMEKAKREFEEPPSWTGFSFVPAKLDGTYL